MATKQATVENDGAIEELDAMRNVHDALVDISPEAQERVISWASNFFRDKCIVTMNTTMPDLRPRVVPRTYSATKVILKSE